MTTWAGLSPDLPFRNTMVTWGIILMAPGQAMIQTMLQAGNRRFTTKNSRGAGFNLWYLFMNVGAAAGGFIIDFVRKVLGVPNAHIISFSVFTSILCIIVASVMIRDESQLYGPDETPPVEDKNAAGQKPWEIAWAVISNSVFWRFVVLFVLILAVRAVFLYLHLICPKFWVRVIGPDAAIGSLQALNPIFVIIGLVLLIPILGRFSVYGMLTKGAIVSALSLFVIAIPAWGNTAYWTTAGFLLLLTIGEIVWSPRLQEYVAAIAPKGQEGTYFGISMVPWFVAKGIVSSVSGHLLGRYVPEYPKGEPILRDRLAAGQIPFSRSPSMMFIILGSAALIGPVIAILMKGWFTKGARWEGEDETVTPAASTMGDSPDEAEPK